MEIKYHEIDKFTKEFKKLLKKYRTLDRDFEIAKKHTIEMLHIKRKDNKSCYEIPGFNNEICMIYKIKKFACKAMKGKGSRSGIRIIYAYFPKTDEIYFLEIYYKGNKENEDRDRIKAFIRESWK